MENIDVDYLSYLSDEIKLIIFSYLDSFDRVNIRLVSKNFERLTVDKVLVRNLNFHKEYRCTNWHFQDIFSNKIRANVITSLNINSVYWISRNNINRCLKLPMLQYLYALDTNININDILSSKLIHLHTLAFTVSNESFPLVSKVQSSFVNLRKLCMHLDFQDDYYYSICDILQYFQNLEELWLMRLPSCRAYEDLDAMISTYNFKKFMIWNMHFLNKHVQLVTTYHNRRKMELCLVNDNISDKYRIGENQIKTNQFQERRTGDVCGIYEGNYFTTENWSNFISETRSFPFGVIDAKKLVFKEFTVENINYEELNFSHTFTPCSSNLKSAVASILLTPNTKLLKKLAVSGCFCQQYMEQSTEEEPLFKHQRKVDADFTEESLFKKLTEHSPLIEELEIWDCVVPVDNPKLWKVTFNALSSIKNWRHLQKLMICNVPNHVTASYLIEICQNCIHLSSWFPNTHLNKNLCLSLPHAKSLKDLRYHEDYLPIDRLIESLLQIKSYKLERLVLICNKIEKFTAAPFEKFIRDNRQLRFFCLYIEDISKMVVQRISKQLKLLQLPEQIFFVTNEDLCTLGLAIPTTHKIEMIDNASKICTVDVFNDFNKYS